jgi:hypothetical protein
MVQTTTTRRYDRSMAQKLWDFRREALWIFVGVVLLVEFVDPLILLALATAAVVAALWAYRKVSHRVERSDAQLAPVTALRPAFTKGTSPRAA